MIHSARGVRRSPDGLGESGCSRMHGWSVLAVRDSIQHNDTRHLLIALTSWQETYDDNVGGSSRIKVRAENHVNGKAYHDAQRRQGSGSTSSSSI